MSFLALPWLPSACGQSEHLWEFLDGSSSGNKFLSTCVFWKGFSFLESQLLFLLPLSHAIVFSGGALHCCSSGLQLVDCNSAPSASLAPGCAKYLLGFGWASWVCGWLFGVKFWGTSSNTFSCFPPHFCYPFLPERIPKLNDSLFIVKIFLSLS